MSDDHEDQPRDDARNSRESSDAARDAAVRALVGNAVAIGLQLGLVLAITKRDWLTRQAARVKWYVRREWRSAAADAAVAGLQAAVSEWEHRAPEERTTGS